MHLRAEAQNGEHPIAMCILEFSISGAELPLLWCCPFSTIAAVW